MLAVVQPVDEIVVFRVKHKSVRMLYCDARTQILLNTVVVFTYTEEKSSFSGTFYSDQFTTNLRLFPSQHHPQGFSSPRSASLMLFVLSL